MKLLSNNTKKNIYRIINSSYFYILLLIIFAVITHLSWFQLSGIITHGDWTNNPNELAKDLYKSWTTWVSYVNFGFVNIQLPYYFFMSIWSFFSSFNPIIDFDNSKLVFLIPIAIFEFVTPYIFVKKLTNSNFISFVGALFYGTTTYGLSNQVPIHFVYAISPLILYSFLLALEKNIIYRWIIFILFYFIGVCYEIRMMYILTFILIFYFLAFYVKKIKIYLPNLLITGIIFILLNAFWMLPFIYSDTSESISVLTHRGIFGNFLADILHSITTFTWNWTGSKPDIFFVKQTVLGLFWIPPLIIFFSLIFIKKQFYKYVLFFLFISILGILLSKQSTPPFIGLYEWLYNHFPGFNLFRESSKFFIVTSIGYLGLISYILLSLKSNVRKHSIYILFSISLIICSIFFALPLINQSIGGLMISKQIPTDYDIYKKYLLKQNVYFRTLWVPTFSRWSISTNLHPSINCIEVAETIWKDIALDEKNKSFAGIKCLNILASKNVNYLLDNSSIKYIVIPLQDNFNDDDFFIYYGPREHFINILSRIPYLKKIDIGTKNLKVYENMNFKPHFYLTEKQETYKELVPYINVQNQYIDPSHYKVSIKAHDTPVFLNFTDSYHSNWKITDKKLNLFYSFFDKKYFISNATIRNDGNLVSFKIPKTSEQKTYTIIFQNQIYFYLGLIVSITTLLSCIIYLLIMFIYIKIYGKR